MNQTERNPLQGLIFGASVHRSLRDTQESNGLKKPVATALADIFCGKTANEAPSRGGIRRYNLTFIGHSVAMNPGLATNIEAPVLARRLPCNQIVLRQTKDITIALMVLR